MDIMCFGRSTKLIIQVEQWTFNMLLQLPRPHEFNVIERTEKNI